MDHPWLHLFVVAPFFVALLVGILVNRKTARDLKQKNDELEQAQYQLQLRKDQDDALIKLGGYIANISRMDLEELRREIPWMIKNTTGQDNLIRVTRMDKVLFEAKWMNHSAHVEDYAYQECFGSAEVYLEHELFASTHLTLTAIAFEVERRVTELQLGIRDHLTGLCNRRKFDEALAYELERARRYEGCLSLVMLDIDHFKPINDRFGHEAGDQVLVQVSQVIDGAHRREDTAARYGGEEFAILLPEIGIMGAFGFAEKLREEIKEHTFTVEHHGEVTEINVTVSLGVATFPASEHLLSDADRALGESKESGRNCTTRTVQAAI